MKRPLRILALVHRVPYPPNKGEKIRAYYELTHLARQGHAIDLATFADVDEDRHHGPQLAEFCRDVRVVFKDRRIGKLRSAWQLPTGAPLSVGYFHSVRLALTVKQWLAHKTYDAAFCYSSPMAEYVRGTNYGTMARVMDFVDVDSDKWAQYAAHTKQPMRAVYELESRRLARYERAIAREFDASILVSPAEAEAFRKVAPDAKDIVAIPNGVDVDFFGQTERRPISPATLVFVGQMDYFANVDGVRYFAESVFPLIRAKAPATRFRIVGRAPTPEVMKLAALPGVEVTGSVPDVRAHLGEATLMVAPLRIARGIQNKVLEGMAARLPIVASPAAFEGIAGKDGEHAYVREDPAAMAAATLELLSDEVARRRLAQNARSLVERVYGWTPAMDRLEALLFDKVARLAV